mgnify:CR=1 FL=1
MSYKILVVEDDNQIQELIVEFLSSQGYKLIWLMMELKDMKNLKG